MKKTKINKINLHTLPDEILRNICLYFYKYRSLFNFLFTSKYIYKITQNDNFWKDIFYGIHPYGYPCSFNQDKPWKEKYYIILKMLRYMCNPRTSGIANVRNFIKIPYFSNDKNLIIILILIFPSIYNHLNED